MVGHRTASCTAAVQGVCGPRVHLVQLHGGGAGQGGVGGRVWRGCALMTLMKGCRHAARPGWSKVAACIVRLSTGAAAGRWPFRERLPGCCPARRSQVIVAPRSNNLLDTERIQGEFPEVLAIKESLIKWVPPESCRGSSRGGGAGKAGATPSSRPLLSLVMCMLVHNTACFGSHAHCWVPTTQVRV
jgi:hypothetical protein